MGGHVETLEANYDDDSGILEPHSWREVQNAEGIWSEMLFNAYASDDEWDV